MHSTELLDPRFADSHLCRLVNLWPGVPVFFFISGLLISKSYESAQNVRQYAVNRILRIYPALLICVLINLVMVGFTGYFSRQSVSWTALMVLAAAKTTVVQFYNPDYMRGFGDGVLNGSLWTITVELQFYAFVPIFYECVKRTRLRFGIASAIVISASVVANILLYWLRSGYSDTLLWKLARVSCAPWVYMFVVGMMGQRYFSRIMPVLMRINIWALITTYFAVAYLARAGGVSLDNSVPPYMFAVLCVTVLRAAYSFEGFTRMLLRGYDLSYGLYLWHMPLVNQFLYQQVLGGASVILSLSISVLIAMLSWRLLEKPILGLKRYSIRASHA